MKKLIEVTVAIKSVAAMVLAGQIFLFLIIGTFFGLSSMDFSFIWQAIVIAVVTALLQCIAFAEDVIKKMRYTFRLVTFSIPLYIILTGFALIFNWFPWSIYAWLTFTLLFLVIFGAFTFAFAIYARIVGKKYNESLSIYNRKSTV